MRKLHYIAALALYGCAISPIALYDQTPVEDVRPHIGSLYALQIYQDGIAPDMWVSPETQCINARANDEAAAGNSSLEIEWDKPSGGCDWIGMGFGWDNWSGKDLSESFENMGIHMRVRAKEGELKGLPVALALEDYDNQQAYCGFSRKYIQEDLITDKEWATVIIPLTSFPVKGYDVDIGNIKQFMIQFEASGHVLLDDIRLIEHEGNGKNSAKAEYVDAKVNVNGKAEIDEWGEPSLTIDKDRVHIKYDENNLYFMAYIHDENPLFNDKTGEDIWNGDCLEIAFSTNPNSDPSRPMYLPTDHQIGVKLVAQPYLWDWKSGKEVVNGKSGMAFTSDGVLVEVQIPLSHFGDEAFEPGTKVGLEIAIDRGNENGRYQQSRWNEPDAEGFYQSPFLWGTLELNADQP